MGSGEFHKLYQTYVQTKRSIDPELYIDKNETIDVIIKKSKDLERFYKFRSEVWFSFLKTKYEDNDSILMLFFIDYENGKHVSKSFSEKIVELVEIVEKHFYPLDDIIFERSPYQGCEFSVLKIIKIIEQDEE